jgi:alpha-galactosidase
MSIEYSPEKAAFHLKTRETSYVVGIEGGKHPVSLYWGRRLRDWSGEAAPSAAARVERPFTPNPDPARACFSLDTLPREYPAFGNTDFRSPAFQVLQEDGSTVADLAYRSHRVSAGKPPLAGLPSTYVESESEADTLEIELVDELIGLEVTLSYSVLPEYDAVARSVRFRNSGAGRLRLLRALSASVDLPRSDLDMLQLSGDWARERAIVRRSLVPGGQSIESRRGASSHQHNPFIALLDRGAGEDSGEVYAMSLVYSGNFLAQAEVDRLGGTRLSIGINPFEFGWLLDPGEEFQAPEAVLVRSSDGLGGMSRAYHELYRSRLCRGAFRDEARPILVNNWEATYFDFDARKIVALGEEARELGIELLVLDDGWFGRRDDDRSSLGDWRVDERKLPLGLSDLAARLGEKGLKFGLWVEPEMVSPDSDLYRAHPDWCLHVPSRQRSESRHQLVLDMGRPEVRRHAVDAISAVLRSAPIAYVKWDMNRHMTEVGSAGLPPERQRETGHRYILGLYAAMDEITRAFPHVLFESCSGGGGRFDPGILAYMPQAWTSDNTDAVCRLKIQYGTSIAYPPIAMGAHVSAAPNHQVGRSTPLEFRGDVAMSGNLGYELDLGALDDAGKAEVARQVAFYKRVRSLVQFGDFYRILSPFEGDDAAWSFVSRDKGEAWVSFFRPFALPNAPLPILRLKGLDREADYRVVPCGPAGEDRNPSARSVGGDELMYAGLELDLGHGDARSCSLLLKRIESSASIRIGRAK